VQPAKEVLNERVKKENTSMVFLLEAPDPSLGTPLRTTALKAMLAATIHDTGKLQEKVCVVLSVVRHHCCLFAAVCRLLIIP